MKNLIVYLTFDGDCEQALHHYENCLKGKITSLQRFKDMPADPESDHQVPAEHGEKVMHAEFKAESIHFMASDNMPGRPLRKGNNITLSIDLDSENEQDEIFNSLSEGGKVNMEIQDTFWGARFGMLTDKFGVHWMLNCNKS